MTLASPARRSGVVTAAVKLLKVMALILLFYLLQAAVMPHLKVLGVMPNLLMVVIAVMTVSYGKQYAFITGAITGIILESMAFSIPLFYVVIYPVLALLCAQLFADMSDVKREMRRIREAQRQSEVAAEIKIPYARRKIKISFRRNSPYDLEPHLRIFLNALTLTALYEGMILIYVALGGVPVGFGHFKRSFFTLGYTGAACVLMFPARAFLGMYRRRFVGKNREERQGISTDPELLRQLAVVPDEAPVEKPSRLKTIFKWRPGEKGHGKSAIPRKSPEQPEGEETDKEAEV